ncbi:MAG: hypothetical protein P8O91_02115 [Luminiphilus sp.]|nr:hypothetical protein [Luminiphilus sp.]
MARFSILVILSILSAVSQADTPTTPIEYSQDWEGDEFEVLSGWLAYIDAFETDCVTTKGYGYAYTIGAGQVAVLADGIDSKVLNVFSNYDDGNQPDLCLKSSVYREVTLVDDNVGDYSFSFIAEPPEAVGSNTNGFIKVLDPAAGYAAIGLEAVETTAGGEVTVSLTVDESMVGKLLQFGFDTLAAGYDNSGMQYDNLVFGAASSGGSSGNGGTAEGASTTFDLLLQTIDAGRRGSTIDKTAPASES